MLYNFPDSSLIQFSSQIPSVSHFDNLLNKFHHAVQFWLDPDSSLIQLRAQILNVLLLGNLLNEFHHAVQSGWTLEFSRFKFNPV